MRRIYKLPWVLLVAGLGCASGRKATQPATVPTSGDNVIISTMQGAGRSIVSGTKRGYQTAKSGVQKWIDPASADSVSPERSSSSASSKASTADSGQTVIRGAQSESQANGTARALGESLSGDGDSGRSPASSGNSSTRSTRAVGTRVTDTFVIQ